MLKKIFNFLKNKERMSDVATMLLGLLMLTALVVFGLTGNKFSMYLIIISGGFMNVMNGYRSTKQKGKQNLGYSMMMLGVVILVLGMVIMMI